MNSFGYTSGFLRQAILKDRSRVLETGWGRIFAGYTPAAISYAHLPQDERLRFTLDYPDDLKFFRAVLEALGGAAETASDAEIIQLVLDRGFYALNAALAHEYWAAFRCQMETEKGSASGA